MDRGVEAGVEVVVVEIWVVVGMRSFEVVKLEV